MPPSRPRRPERAAYYDDPMFEELKGRLGDNLRQLRAKKGWTQEQAAAACSMPHSLYHPVEAGKRNVTLVTLTRLARGFRVDPSKLIAPPR